MTIRTTRRRTRMRTRLGSGGAAAALAALVLTGCAGPSTSEAVSRHEFTRDKERCWLQATDGLSFTCPEGPCVVTIPHRIEFQRCMERRGWELEDLDVAAPHETLNAPPDAWEHEGDADWADEDRDGEDD